MSAIPRGSNSSPRRYWGPGQAPERHRPPPGVLHAHQFTSVDDQDTSYQLSASPGSVYAEWSGVLDLYPNPPREIRWLALSGSPGSAPRAFPRHRL